MSRQQALPRVMADMAERIANGAEQYGEPLTTGNGRDALQDAYEEALDLALYLKQAIMEREAATPQLCFVGIDLGSKEQTCVSITWPANATADQRRAILEQALDVATVAGPATITTSSGPIAEAKADLQVQPGQPDVPRDLLYAQPQPEWPGPDWAQAPTGCVGWVAQNVEYGACCCAALWVFGTGRLSDDGSWSTYPPHALSVEAPLFGYTGHWRDSLRKRPEVVS